MLTFLFFESFIRLIPFNVALGLFIRSLSDGINARNLNFFFVSQLKFSPVQVMLAAIGMLSSAALFISVLFFLTKRIGEFGLWGW